MTAGSLSCFASVRGAALRVPRARRARVPRLGRASVRPLAAGKRDGRGSETWKDGRADAFDATGKDAVLGMELTPERYIDAVAEIVDHLGCSSSAVRAGLFSAKIQESAGHHSEAASRARARVFKALEEEHNMQEAYTVALSVSDPQREQDCLNSLIASLCANSQES